MSLTKDESIEFDNALKKCNSLELRSVAHAVHSLSHFAHILDPTFHAPNAHLEAVVIMHGSVHDKMLL